MPPKAIPTIVTALGLAEDTSIARIIDLQVVTVSQLQEVID